MKKLVSGVTHIDKRIVTVKAAANDNRLPIVICLGS